MVNEELARLAVLEEADRDVTFVTGDLELVRERHARVGHAMPDRLIDLAAQRRQLPVPVRESRF